MREPNPDNVRLALYGLFLSIDAAVRDRASVSRFVEGKTSVYSLVAKDQLMSFRDLSFAACSSRERAEVEASARSQRQAAEARAAAAVDGGSGGRSMAEQRRWVVASAPAGVKEEGADHAVAAAPSLADPQMDEHWSAVSLSPVFCPRAKVTKQSPQGSYSSCSS